MKRAIERKGDLYLCFDKCMYTKSRSKRLEHLFGVMIMTVPKYKRNGIKIEILCNVAVNQIIVLRMKKQREKTGDLEMIKPFLGI